MKKIKNPYAGTAEGMGYNCFACAPENPCGLKMEFFEDGKIAFTYMTKEDDEAVGLKAGEHDGIVEIGKAIEGVGKLESIL